MGFQINVMNKRAIQISLLLVAICVALSFGFSYGNVGNQETYLPHALNHIHPAFLRKDWLIHDTTVYHSNFRWVIVGLSWLGSVAWGVAVLNLSLITTGLYFLYRLISTLASDVAFGAMALLMVCIVLDRTNSVGASYLFSTGLQPSTLATVIWLAVMWAFLCQRYAISGFLLALAGLFHTNFLILGIGLFTLAHLFLKENKLARRLLVQIGPSVLLMGFSLPMLLEMAGGESAKQARDIFLSIRAPHHYVPLTYLPQFLYLGGWLLCGVSASFAIVDFSLRRPVQALLAALAISVGGATLLTTVVFVPQVSQLYVWRLAPFLLILSQMIVAIWLARQLSGNSGPVRHSRILTGASILGALMILRWTLRVSDLSVAFGVVAVLVAVYLIAWFARRRANQAINQHAVVMIGYAGIIAAALLALPRIPEVIQESTLLNDDKAGLNAWARQTPDTSVFLVPVELGNFRLLAERPIVVDWKSTPIRPDELIEWHKRISTLAGKPVHSFNEAVAGYRSHNLVSLRRIAAIYHADYIVIDTAKHNLADKHERPVFSDGNYSVFLAHPPVMQAPAPYRSAEVNPLNHSRR